MNAPLSETDRLKARIAALEAELAEWELQYGDAPTPPALSAETEDFLVARALYRISRGPAAMLFRLMASPGRIVPGVTLHDACRADDRTENPKLVNVYVHRLRKTLGEDAIEIAWGQGYRITEAAAARVSAQIAATRARGVPLLRNGAMKAARGR